MFVNDFNCDVYFCSSLIEIIILNSTINFKFKDYYGKFDKKKTCEFNRLECPQCKDSTSQINDCEMNLFDCQKYLLELKKSISIDRLRKSNKLTKQLIGQDTVSTQSYPFFTQNDADISTTTQKTNETESQYLRINSILDTLESIGYYGYLTFIGIIQRIGKHIINKFKFRNNLI